MIQKYDIQKKNIYNINEKENVFNNVDKSRVIYFKHDLFAYKTQNENREWIFFIEYISVNERLFVIFFIFKNKR